VSDLHLEILVEEPSMEAALALLLARLIGEISFAIHSHQGKTDLLAKLPPKLAAYGRWIPESYRIVVVVDRDDDDCIELKQRLEAMGEAADLMTRNRAGSRWKLLPRLAIEELEAWYFGDWQAVRAAYPRVKANVPRKAGYRDPDAIEGGTWEAFERVLQEVGYFATGLRKIEAARAIAPCMVPARNTSASFRCLRDALSEMSRP
jgi:regulator of sigma D